MALADGVGENANANGSGKHCALMTDLVGDDEPLAMASVVAKDPS